MVSGLVEVSIHDSAPGCETDRIGYLEAWYVDPDWRGQGAERPFPPTPQSPTPTYPQAGEPPLTQTAQTSPRGFQPDLHRHVKRFLLAIEIDLHQAGD